jgi:hypothetical protein
MTSTTAVRTRGYPYLTLHINPWPPVPLVPSYTCCMPVSSFRPTVEHLPLCRSVSLNLVSALFACFFSFVFFRFCSLLTLAKGWVMRIAWRCRIRPVCSLVKEGRSAAAIIKSSAPCLTSRPFTSLPSTGGFSPRRPTTCTQAQGPPSAFSSRFWFLF